jgi:hypothetical protein
LFQFFFHKEQVTAEQENGEVAPAPASEEEQDKHKPNIIEEIPYINKT